MHTLSLVTAFGIIICLGNPPVARSADPLPPTAMPRDHAGPRPKPRTVAEVNAVLAGAPNPPLKTRPIRVVLVAGEKDHGPGEHDYPAWQKAWAALFAWRTRSRSRPRGNGRRGRSSRRPT